MIINTRFFVIIFIIFWQSACAMQRSSNCRLATYDNTLKQAVYWYQNSAEKKALFRQAYSAGSRYVQAWVSSHQPKEKSWGVILDIDETVLDNSWHYKQCGDVKMSEADFSHYISLAKKSVALPGAPEFTKLVHNLGGYVTLLSNRDGQAMSASLENLKQQNIYFDQVIMANYAESKKPKDKNPRFNAVKTGNYDAKNMVWSNILPAYEVIAYFGDNIQDFPEFSQKESNTINFDLFSQGYFILPNPIYGSWQNY